MTPSPAAFTLTDAMLVTPEGVRRGSLHVRDGRIADLTASTPQASGCIPLHGAFLLPGLVDLHTDNFERAIEPRTAVRIPGHAAMAMHDRETVAAGVTTVFDALCLTDWDDDAARLDSLRQGVAALESLAPHLKADHFLHLRVELPAGGILPMFRQLADNPLLRLVSLMDHTPGEKQFATIEAWRLLPWNQRRAPEELARIERVFEEGRARAPGNRRAVLARLAGSGIAIASHDDRTEAHIAEAAADGIRISEFPVTFAAARAARAAGMAILGGAPNVLRGGSHSGNIAVADLAGQGLLDALASDYVPAAMLEALFRLHHAHGVPMQQASAMASDLPARLVGLADRGRLAVGLRADLVAARWHESGAALVEGVWREGIRVA